ncbi:MAG: ferritin-like domain-containing protein [Deltaproteobacteria bacterium]|nr:ferritin-like domain-containing protein [Deltaproteobacteria bacterium]
MTSDRSDMGAPATAARVFLPATGYQSLVTHSEEWMANSAGYHESEDKLRTETQDNHRALTSMMEELEAADWYDQRVDAATDAELKEILAHNRDEEKEHFVMLLEWLRRRDPKFSSELKERLFAPGDIVAREQDGKDGGGAEAPAVAPSGGSLGIGSLKGGDSL